MKTHSQINRFPTRDFERSEDKMRRTRVSVSRTNTSFKFITSFLCTLSEQESFLLRSIILFLKDFSELLSGSGYDMMLHCLFQSLTLCFIQREVERLSLQRYRIQYMKPRNISFLLSCYIKTHTHTH
jgi:hypothetical protein